MHFNLNVSYLHYTNLKKIRTWLNQTISSNHKVVLPSTEFCVIQLLMGCISNTYWARVKGLYGLQVQMYNSRGWKHIMTYKRKKIDVQLGSTNLYTTTCRRSLSNILAQCPWEQPDHQNFPTGEGGTWALRLSSLKLLLIMWTLKEVPTWISLVMFIRAIQSFRYDVKNIFQRAQ